MKKNLIYINRGLKRACFTTKKKKKKVDNALLAGGF
jgi:hypothetical protein